MDRVFTMLPARPAVDQIVLVMVKKIVNFQIRNLYRDIPVHARFFWIPAYFGPCQCRGWAGSTAHSGHKESLSPVCLERSYFLRQSWILNGPWAISRACAFSNPAFSAWAELSHGPTSGPARHCYPGPEPQDEAAITSNSPVSYPMTGKLKPSSLLWI